MPPNQCLWAVTLPERGWVSRGPRGRAVMKKSNRTGHYEQMQYTKSMQRKELGWLQSRFDSKCRRVRETPLGVHRKAGLCCE